MKFGLLSDMIALGYSSEVGDFTSEDDAIRRAKEEIADGIEKFNSYYFCKIEHRIIPIYK